MSNKTLAWLAWSLVFFATLLIAVSAVFVLLNPGAQFLYWASGPSFGVLYPVIGALIISRLPRHRMGWLFCASGLWAVESFAGALGAYFLAEQPAQPVGLWFAWLSLWFWMPAALVATYIALLFPTGDLLSRRWRFAIWMAALGILLNSISIALLPGPSTSGIGLAFNNPIGLVGAESLLRTLQNVGGTLFAASTLVAVLHFVLRLHRAHGHERQQLKWFAFACALAFPLLIMGNSINAFLQTTFARPGTLFGMLVFGTLVSALMPLAAGIAILKYRLYDIDVIIRRTLIYGALTAALILVYFCSVVLFQSALRVLTGQTSNLAIVASTLIIAALFAPLRSRIQALIDRRLYRQKYDAAKVLAAFGVTVRDEVDLARLKDALLDVVNETMQPASTSLWLRKVR